MQIGLLSPPDFTAFLAEISRKKRGQPARTQSEAGPAKI